MTRRISALFAAILFVIATLAAVAQTQPPSPSIRGFVIGGEYSLFAPSYRPAGSADPLGNGSNWWFGYRPDIPQTTGGFEAPISYGANGVFQGGFPNGDDWPMPAQHPIYTGLGSSGVLPPVDYFNQTTLYPLNTGPWPGESAFDNITANHDYLDGDVVSVSNVPHWGGFYGVLHGSSALHPSLDAQGYPWSSSGSDFGASAGESAINFYIYDVRGSTPILDSTGHYTYDLTSAPDPDMSHPTNKARGRISLFRKDLSVHFRYGAVPGYSGTPNYNTFLLQGTWKIANVEGSFLDQNGGPFTTGDIGKAAGSWGQPQDFFPGILYDDFNFRNVQIGSTVIAQSSNKYLTYEFMPAALQITRTYAICSNAVTLTLVNNGDVDLSNITVTDSLLSTPRLISGPLAARSSTTITIPVSGIPALAAVTTAATNTFRVGRVLDLTGSTGTFNDGTSAHIGISAASSGVTQLSPCAQISGTVFVDANGNHAPDSGEGLDNVTVTLSGQDLNGVPVSLTTTTSGGGAYLFASLPPGVYTVSETVPSGYSAVDAFPGVGGTKVDTKTITVSAETPNVSDYSPQNFQVQPLGSISGTAYSDTNGNGVQDAGEPGIGGVTITLGGASAQTVVTNPDGSYQFTNLAPGSYTVSAPATASGQKLSTTTPLSVTLAAGQNSTGNNFGYVTGSIAGVVYTDTNGNGVQDAGEPGLGGVTVTLGGTSSQSVVTNPDGTYKFSGLLAGSYTVSSPATTAGEKLSTASPLTVTLSEGQNSTGNNFGYVLGSISGVVYTDSNANGTQDGGESGLGGVTVTLTGASSQTVVTNPDGSYRFTGLVSGSYSVSTPATASGESLETTSPLSITLAEGQNSTGNNFGYVLGSIAGIAYTDTNGNGVHDAGEPVLAGVTVTLSGAGTQTAVTAPDGSYKFTGLVAGNYTVSAPATVSGESLETGSPLTIALAAGQNSVNNNFGYVLGSISGVVYTDANSNGQLDTGEAGIAGVTVILTGPVTQTIVTGPGGTYSFTGLPAGSYSVTVPATAAGENLETTNPLPVTLAAGQNSAGNNFGYVAGSISGVVYTDSNGNGVRDANEPGIGGVTVTLSGASNQTVVTNPDGSYQFTGLPAGSYSVSSPAVAAGKSLDTASPLAVTLAAGQNSTGNNFGYVAGSISGVVYTDSNGNGVHDASEPGISGVTVTLSGPVTLTVVTGAGGSYSFAGLPAGSYTVSVPSSANGQNLETSGSLNVALSAGQNSTGNNFGYVPGSIAGVVYYDANGNGVQDAGEPGIPGVTVTLSGTSGQTAVTAADGSYRFTGLSAGSYTVSSPAIAGGKNLETSGTLSVTLAAGQNSTGNNFGYILGSISGIAYSDLNGNGVRDSGEPGIGGVTITLSGPVNQTLVTGADGSYRFTGLPAGSYSVSAPGTAAGKSLDTASLLAVTLAAGQNSTNNNFGYAALGALTGSLTCIGNCNTGGSSSSGCGNTWDWNSGCGSNWWDNGNSCGTGSGSGSNSCGTVFSGVTVTLTGPNGVVTVVTNANGQYSVAGLPSGLYVVSVPGAVNGDGILGISSQTVAVAPGQTATQNFSYQGGTISGSAFYDRNCNFTFNTTDTGLSGVQITLKDSVGHVISTTTTTSNGAYSFSGCWLHSGVYTIIASCSDCGKALETAGSISVTVGPGGVSANNNFAYVSWCGFGRFKTYTHTCWGGTGCRDSSGDLLRSCFSQIYTCGHVAIGGGCNASFTSARSCAAFLPQSGTPSCLSHSCTNPTSGCSSFASEVLALRLNVDCSNASVTRCGLAALHLTNGKFAGCSVGQVLAIANRCLGGDTSVLPSNCSIADLNNTVDCINGNFYNGSCDRGNLQ